MRFETDINIYILYLTITKICNSADEYVFPMLNINLQRMSDQYLYC